MSDQSKKLGYVSFTHLMEATQRALLRFPFVILCAVATAYFLIESGSGFRITGPIRIAGSLALGIPLFLSLRLLFESRAWTQPGSRFIEFTIGAVFIGAHYLLTRHDESISYPIRYFHLSLALHLLVSFVAFTRRDDENSFWQFNRRLFLRILLSLLYAGVFFCGLALALIAVGVLFKLKIDRKIYADLWVISVVVLQTWHFLAGVPKIEELRNDTSYPKGLKVFVQFLLIPLVSLYTLIMYLYMFRIVASQDWPSGYIGWLVSAVSVLGIFNLLLLDPEKHVPENRWIRTYTRLYYILILPLLALLFVAVGKRVSVYAVTELRYFLIALGCLLTGLSLYFLFSRSKKIRVIPISLFLLAIFALWGPMSAYSTSLRSQKNRAREIMEINGLLKDNKAQRSQSEIGRVAQIELGEALKYIIRNHGAQEVAEWFPAETIEKLQKYEGSGYEVKPRHQSPAPLMAYLGLKYYEYGWTTHGRRAREYFSFRSRLSDVSFQVSGYERAIKYAVHAHSEIIGPPVTHGFEHKGRKLTISFDKSKALLLISEGAQELLTLPVSEKVKELHVDGKSVRRDMITIDGDGGELIVRLVIDEMSGYLDDQGLHINIIEGLLLLN